MVSLDPWPEEAYQRRIFAASEMKSAIKELADSQEPLRHPNGDQYMTAVRTKYLNRAIKAMEAYCNI